MAVIKQTFDDGSILLYDDATMQPLGAFDTGGAYVPPSAPVGQTLADSLLGITVNKVLDKVLGSQTVTPSNAGLVTLPAAQTNNTAMVVGLIAAGIGGAIILSLIFAPARAPSKK